RPRADDAHLGAAELGEIGGDVERSLPAAVDAADPARGHEVNTGHGAYRQRAGHGRRAALPGDGAGGEIAAAHLARVVVVREPLDGVVVDADADGAVEDRDRRGD